MWFAIVWWFLGTHQSCYVRTKYSERGALQASEAGGKKRQTQVFNTVPNLDSNISMLLRAKWYTNTCVLERARLCSHSVLVDCFTLSFTKLPQSQWSLLRMKITKSHGFWWKLNKCFTWSQIIQLNAKKKNIWKTIHKSIKNLRGGEWNWLASICTQCTSISFGIA